MPDDSGADETVLTLRTKLPARYDRLIATCGLMVATAIQAAGFAPSNNLESAIYQATLPRGNYTVILRGKNDGTGVGVVEAYVF